MGITIANPENVKSELEKLQTFYIQRQAELLAVHEAAELETAAKREAELAANRAERHAEADALARQLMTHTVAVDKLLAEVAGHLRARVELAREIRRVAPEKARDFGNVFEQQPPTSGAVTHSGLGYYVRMPVRSGTSLTDHDTRYLQ
jgi:hypothetical protein